MSELIDKVQRRFTKTVFAGVALSALVVACGSSSSGGDGGTASDGCPSFAGAYSVTTEIVTTTCPLGLHVISTPVTWTFVQSAPSCNFTMTNSLYPKSQYAGVFSMDGTQAKVTWSTVTPAPMVSGRVLTYTSESLTISPAVAPATVGTISGSFDWNSAYPCTGTTNVCHGSVPAGCLSPI